MTKHKSQPKSRHSGTPSFLIVVSQWPWTAAVKKKGCLRKYFVTTWEQIWVLIWCLTSLAKKEIECDEVTPAVLQTSTCMATHYNYNMYTAGSNWRWITAYMYIVFLQHHPKHLFFNLTLMLHKTILFAPRWPHKLSMPDVAAANLPLQHSLTYPTTAPRHQPLLLRPPLSIIYKHQVILPTHCPTQIQWLPT